MPEMREDPKNPEDVDSKQEDHVYDTFRYMCMSRPLRAKHVRPELQPGTMGFERRKLVRARKIAKAKGISVAQVYSGRRF